MTAPVNDNVSGAAALAGTSGSTSGTTVEATEDPAGPFSGWDVNDVFWYWDDMPAGDVLVTITPSTGNLGYFEFYLHSGAPAGWSDASDDNWSWGEDGNAGTAYLSHAGGPISLGVITWQGDPPTSFGLTWSWAVPPSAPDNDDKGNAVVLPVGDYWGTGVGSTFGATTDGPYTGLRDVWYTWESLPAGNVYIHVQPRPPFGDHGAVLFSAMPGDATLSTPATFGGGDSSTPLSMQGWHTGGPLTLLVYTDTDTTPMNFDFGWGHDLDATSSHWSGPFHDDWVTGGQGAGPVDHTFTYGGSRNSTDNAGRGPIFAVPPPLPPDDYVPTVWANVRDGVYDPSLPTSGDLDDFDDGATYIGPGGGGNYNAFVFWIGATNEIAAVGYPNFPTPPSGFLAGQSTRRDTMRVYQAIQGWTLGPEHRGPVLIGTELAPMNEAQTQPQTYSSHQGWGWDWLGSLVWETRNYRLHGPITSTPNHTASSSGSMTGGTAAHVDVVETPEIVLKIISDGLTLGSSTGSSPPPNTLDLSVGVRCTFITNDVASAGTTLTTVAGGLVYDLLVAADEASFNALLWDDDVLVALYVDQRNIDDEMPVAPDPTPAPEFPFAAHYGRAWRDNNLIASAGSGLTNDFKLNWEARMPPWRTYRGFPLTPPTGGGWRVGGLGRPRWGESTSALARRRTAARHA